MNEMNINRKRARAFFLGYIESNMLFQSLFVIIAVIGISYMFQHITRDVLSQKTQSKIVKAENISRGLAIGMLLWYAVIFVIAFSELGKPIIKVLGREGNIIFILTSLIACLSIGAFIGKWLAKRYPIV